MVLSMLTFAYIFSGALGLLVLMSIRLYLENTKYSSELKFHLQQKTIASNLAKAKLSIVQTQLSDLSKKTKVENVEELEMLKQESQSLKDKLDEISTNFSSELKNEKERTEIALLNFIEMENLNKNLSQEVEAFEEAHVKLKQEFNKTDELHLSFQKELERKEALLNETIKEKKVLLTKLVGFESREEVLQIKVSDQLKQIQSFDVQKRNQELLVEAMQDKVREREKTFNELKKSNDLLNQKLIEEQRKITAHEKIDSINRRESQAEESKKEFEKILIKRVLRSYSIILKLEKKNMVLRSELRTNKKLHEQEIKNNIIRFPESTKRDQPQETLRSDSKLQLVKDFVTDNKFESGEVKINELEFLKAKLDEARKSLFEIQSTQELSGVRKNKLAA